MVLGEISVNLNQAQSLFDDAYSIQQTDLVKSLVQAAAKGMGRHGPGTD